MKPIIIVMVIMVTGFSITWGVDHHRMVQKVEEAELKAVMMELATQVQKHRIEHGQLPNTVAVDSNSGGTVYHEAYFAVNAGTWGSVELESSDTDPKKWGVTARYLPLVNGGFQLQVFKEGRHMISHNFN